MDEVFVLTREYYIGLYRAFEYVMQSTNVHDLLEYMLEHQEDNYEIHVTDRNNEQIDYLEWRKNE